MKKQKPDPKIREILREYNKDVKRHMSVLSEDFSGQVQLIAEQYGDIKKLSISILKFSLRIPKLSLRIPK